MTVVPQLTITLLIWLVILGTFFSPELKAYSAQLIALLLLFYIMLKHFMDGVRRKEMHQARQDEETLLFLSTYLRPKLESLIDLTSHEENKELLQKQLQLVAGEVSTYLTTKEQEVNNA